MKGISVCRRMLHKSNFRYAYQGPSIHSFSTVSGNTISITFVDAEVSVLSNNLMASFFNFSLA